MYYIVFYDLQPQVRTSACHVLAVAADAIEENPAAPPIDDTDSNANNLARYMIPPLLPY